MSRPWYRRFPDNFIAGTVGLTLEEKGAFSLLLDLIYVRGGPVPDEPRYIAGVCNCSVRKWNAIRQRLLELGKIVVVDGCLMNSRAEKELENAAKTAEELAENGAKGGFKSAENKAMAKKNNNLVQATVKHARATLNQHQDSVLKNGATLSDPTDGVRLDRYSQEVLFKACEAIAGPVPSFVQFKTFPATVYMQAVESMTLVANGESQH